MNITHSLPNIVKVFSVPCASLAPNVVEKYLAGVPVGVYPLPTEVEQYGTGSVEAANELDDGTYYEKTVLQFSTAEEIDNRTPMAFVVKDAQENYYLIGAREAPYPIVEITKGVSSDANVNDVKVTFSRRKSLIPCSI
jgi:hypothetical protein